MTQTNTPAWLAGHTGSHVLTSRAVIGRFSWCLLQTYPSDGRTKCIQATSTQPLWFPARLLKGQTSFRLIGLDW